MNFQVQTLLFLFSKMAYLNNSCELSYDTGDSNYGNWNQSKQIQGFLSGLDIYRGKEGKDLKYFGP